MKKQLRYVTFLLITFLISCSSKEEYVEVPNNNTPESPVVFNPDAAPFQQLSEYRFFEGNLKDLAPSYGVIPYEPINTLFTDYAHKKRFIWMHRKPPDFVYAMGSGNRAAVQISAIDG